MSGFPAGFEWSDEDDRPVRVRTAAEAARFVDAHRSRDSWSAAIEHVAGLVGLLERAEQAAVGYEREIDAIADRYERRIEALREPVLRIQEETGFCPVCEAGPPPHHNDGCEAAA